MIFQERFQEQSRPMEQVMKLKPVSPMMQMEISFEKAKSLRKLPIAQKVEHFKEVKAVATAFFKRGVFKKAAKLYSAGKYDF